jgi:phospholipid/cholesterol/gamma-HCH transport system substrate-binding protein
MARTVYNNTRLGLFVILAFVVFTYAMYRISNKADLFKGSIYIEAVFTDVRGLQPGNNVRFAGINIGSVDDISLQGDTLVLVTMKVAEDVQTYMRKDAQADIGSNGLVGNMLVNISPGPGQAPYVENGDRIASLAGWTGQMMGNLTATTTDLSQLTTSLNEIANKINRGSGTLAVLLNDEAMANDLKAMIQDLERTSSDLGRVATRANKIIAGVEEGEGILGRLMGDEASAKKFDEVLARLDTLAGDQASRVMSDLEKSGADLSASASRLSEIIENLDRKGLTGSILNDTNRVNQLEQIMTNLEEGTSKFNVSMQALQNHWLLRKSVRKMQEKEAEDLE